MLIEMDCFASRGGVDLINPNVKQGFTSLASNSTVTVATTQKPRYVIVQQSRTSLTPIVSMTLLFDIENEKLIRLISKSDNTYDYIDENGTYSNFMTSVTSTSLTLKNATGGVATGYIVVYY